MELPIVIFSSVTFFLSYSSWSFVVAAVVVVADPRLDSLVSLVSFFSFFIFYFFFFRLSFVLMFYWQEENINLCSYTLLSSIGFLYKYPLNNIPFALPTVILVTLWEEQLLLSLHTNIHSQLVSLFRYFNHITHTHTAIATYAHSHQCPQVKFTTTTPCFLMELPLWMLTTISTKFPI